MDRRPEENILCDGQETRGEYFLLAGEERGKRLQRKRNRERERRRGEYFVLAGEER